MTSDAREIQGLAAEAEQKARQEAAIRDVVTAADALLAELRTYNGTALRRPLDALRDGLANAREAFPDLLGDV